MSEAAMKQRTYRAVSRYFARLANRGRLLDVPCGNGILSGRLQAQGFSVTSADIAPEAVETEGLSVV